MAKRRGIQKLTAETLKPFGFKAISGTAFTRQVCEQLHFVGLQYGRFSRGFTFNLGCHFRGIPSLFDFEPVTTDDLEDLDCGLRERVGRFIGDGLDLWWESDNSELPGALKQASWAIDRGFAECLKKWGSDGALLLESHVKNRAGAIKLSRPLFRWMGPQWEFQRYAFVAMLANRRGNKSLAREFYDKALKFQRVATDADHLNDALKVKRRKTQANSLKGE